MHRSCQHFFLLIVRGVSRVFHEGCAALKIMSKMVHQKVTIFFVEHKISYNFLNEAIFVELTVYELQRVQLIFLNISQIAVQTLKCHVAVL